MTENPMVMYNPRSKYYNPKRDVTTRPIPLYTCSTTIIDTDLERGMLNFTFNNSDLINSPAFPGIIDKETPPIKIKMLDVFGILIPDFFKSKFHLKINKK